MIKAAGTTGDGRPLLIFGLSRTNTQLLLDGRPILVDTADTMGVTGGPVVYLVGGETEEAIAESLGEFVGPTTVVHPIESKA